MEKLLTSMFGEKCYFCGREGRLVCYGCESKCLACLYGVCIKCQGPAVLGFTHAICQLESQKLLPSQLFSVYEYSGLISQVIKKSKYFPKQFALLRLMSASGAKLASKVGFCCSKYTVLPIPVSRLRERERGFNQSEIIAKAVAKEFGLPMDNSILTRIRDTDKQFSLHKVDRTRNLADAFKVTTDVRGGRFLLVDDICTTGSTLMSACNALLSAGATDVKCFALTRRPCYSLRCQHSPFGAV